MIRIRAEQMAMFEGVRPAPPDNRANRGMDFEGRLEGVHARYAATGAARVDKQYVKALPVKNGQWAKVIGRCTVDYTGVMRGGRMVAFDAKDCRGAPCARPPPAASAGLSSAGGAHGRLCVCAGAL